MFWIIWFIGFVCFASIGMIVVSFFEKKKWFDQYDHLNASDAEVFRMVVFLAAAIWLVSLPTLCLAVICYAAYLLMIRLADKIANKLLQIYDKKN